MSILGDTIVNRVHVFPAAGSAVFSSAVMIVADNAPGACSADPNTAVAKPATNDYLSLSLKTVNGHHTTLVDSQGEDLLIAKAVSERKYSPQCEALEAFFENDRNRG